MLLFLYIKSFTLKIICDFHFNQKFNRILRISLKLLRRSSGLSAAYVVTCPKRCQFFPLYPRMKPRDLHNSHDFQTLYAIFDFFRMSVHTLVIKFLDKDASTFKFFRAYGISFDSGT